MDKLVGSEKKAMYAAGWHAELGTVDPQNNRPSGGVGVLVRKPRRCVPVKLRTEAYKDALKTWRLAIYDMDLASDTVACTLLVAGPGQKQGM